MQLTIEDLLEVFLGEDRATRIGWIGDDYTGSPLVDQALHVLQVNLPRLLRLQIKYGRQDECRNFIVRDNTLNRDSYYCRHEKATLVTVS